MIIPFLSVDEEKSLYTIEVFNTESDWNDIVPEFPLTTNLPSVDIAYSMFATLTAILYQQFIYGKEAGYWDGYVEACEEIKEEDNDSDDDEFSSGDLDYPD